MAIRTLTAARSRNTALGGRGTLYITGWQASAGAFANEAESVKKRARDITDRAAERIFEDQRTSGRFVDRTGTTRDSIRNTKEDDGDRYVRDIGPTWFVARYLVFGTVKMDSKWDLFAAAQPGMQQWLSDMSDVSTL